jgi:DNA-binding transcriptional ArsR family regulator
MTQPEVDDVLAALADPTRRRLLDVLAARGEATGLAAEWDRRLATIKRLAEAPDPGDQG